MGKQQTGQKLRQHSSTQRVNVEVQKIGNYRLNPAKDTNPIEYEVFWKDQPNKPTWQTMEHLQNCHQLLKQKFSTENKIKKIIKMNRNTQLQKSSPSSYVKFSQQMNKFKLEEQKIILEKSKQLSEELQNKALSSALEEGQMSVDFTMGFCNFNQNNSLQKNNKINENIDFEQQMEVLNLNKNLTEDKKISLSPKKNKKYNSGVQSLNNDSYELQGQKNIKNKLKQKYFQSQRRIMSTSKRQKRQNSKHYQTNQKMCQVQKPKPKNLKMQNKNVNISIYPIKQENIMIRKCIRTGRQINFQVNVYDLNKNKVTKTMPVQQLRIKAPYALLMYYQSRIIY